MGFSSPAAENLVPYSKTQPQIFKTGQLTPVKDLKVLIKDYAVCGDPPLPSNWRCQTDLSTILGHR